ncbi:hypothetical protein FGB62_260g011 [Gracilaria domingensis]|nr:hypothetical protein FGB62_260g011 [Gracilaria domingensis]
MKCLIDKFLNSSRLLVAESEVDYAEKMKICTACEANLTADTVLAALALRSSGFRMYKNAAELRQLAQLAPRRSALMEQLSATRVQRCLVAAQRATRRRDIAEAVAGEVFVAGEEAADLAKKRETNDRETVDCTQELAVMRVFKYIIASL